MSRGSPVVTRRRSLPTMDISEILENKASTSNSRSIAIDNDQITVDAGLLTVFDTTELDAELYKSNLEECLQSTARLGTQALINALFSLPITKSQDGPLAVLPPIVTQLPRQKPLPKPKPPTKWEQFAKAKGIQKTVREKKIWDEEKQEWVNRWGRDAKNKEKEEQWITEVPDNAPDDYDPIKEEKDARKSRVSKNEKQRAANVARAQAGPMQPAKTREDRKDQIRNQVLHVKASTASMGKFDKKLQGEPKLRGVKRKFEPAESSLEKEKASSLALISKLDHEGPALKKAKRESGAAGGGDDVLNVRKAVRHASGGRGPVALAKSKSSGKKGKSKR